MTKDTRAKPEPTFVLVPGGWHVAGHMKLLEEELEKLGYGFRSETLATINNPKGRPEDDARVIRGAMREELDEGKDVILYTHSASGIGGFMALEAFINDIPRVSDQGEEGQGSLLGFIWQSSFIIPAGMSAVGFYLGGEDKTEGWPLPWQIEVSETIYHSLAVPSSTSTKKG